MKKIFSLLFALLILVSGMHLTMATHICGDEIAAVKWSIMHEKAGCGMESPDATGSTTISSDCCHDKLDAFALDSNYSRSNFQITKPIQAPLQAFYIPANIGLLLSVIGFTPSVNIPPPDAVHPSTVYLADICVFLI